MKIILSRYWGDAMQTKSRMKFVDARGKTQLECEAREPAFADFTETFRGCSHYCLPAGVFECKVVPTEFSPTTLMVQKAPGHRSCTIAWSDVKQVMSNSVLVGQSDGEENPEWRRMEQQEETFCILDELVRWAYVANEKIVLHVENEYVII